jgi:hypothetical protein
MTEKRSIANRRSRRTTMNTTACLVCIAAATMLSATAWLVAAAKPAPALDPAALRSARNADAAVRTEQARAAALARHGHPGRAVHLLSPFGPAPAHRKQPDDDEPAIAAVSRDEAQRLEDDHAGDVVHVAHGCCGAEDIEVARGIVHGLFAAHDLAPDAPVLIDDDVPWASQLAARLRDDGLKRVLLVVASQHSEQP